MDKNANAGKTEWTGGGQDKDILSKEVSPPHLEAIARPLSQWDIDVELGPGCLSVALSSEFPPPLCVKETLL